MSGGRLVSGEELTTQLRLQKLELENENFKKEQVEMTARLDKQDARQEKLLWAVFGLILALAGTILGAAAMGLVPMAR